MKLIECPRDAMQGIKTWIPTETKIRYINTLLKCNFDTLDMGSFVSEKAIPQMKDTAEVIERIETNTNTKLLVIIANERGATQAINWDKIDYLGYPFSISETFQKRNANSTIEESWRRLATIQNIAQKNNKEVVVYLSMGFGNPYGDPWNADLVVGWSERLYSELGISIHSLSDTVGNASTETINYLFSHLISSLPKVEFGAHLHVRKEDAQNAIKTAYNAGCRRFDGAINGYGGCPMATDELTGNMPTEQVIEWLEEKNIQHPIHIENFKLAMNEAIRVFS